MGVSRFSRWLLLASAAMLSAQPAMAALTRAQVQQYRQVGLRFGLTPEQVAEVYTFIDQNRAVISAAAQQNQVNQNAFLAIARELGLRGYGQDPQRILSAIRDQAGRAAQFEAENRELRKRVDALEDASIRTPAEAILERAGAAYAAGDLDGAQAALEELIAMRTGELTNAIDAWEAASRAAMTFASTRGDLETVQRLRTQAREARKLRADQQREADRHNNWLDAMAVADTAYKQGDLRGDNAKLLLAITTYRDDALPLTDRVTSRDDWAATKNSLGIALAVLGGRETGTARLEEAVTAFQLAVEETTREHFPLEWGAAQHNLGSALSELGARESNTARLEQAVTAFGLALEERNRERVALDWAATQYSLGNVLRKLGELENGTARLEQAVAAYRLALEERTRERVPLDWARTLNGLGNVRQRLGTRESDTARLEEAAKAYRLALEELTRERVPLEWAAAQSNLGHTLASLGRRELGTARLEQAVTAFRLALMEQTRERVPLDWAGTQGISSYVDALISERNERGALLQKAWASLNETVPVVRQSGNQRMEAFVESVASHMRSIAIKYGWTLPDIRASGGLEGTTSN